MYVCADFNSVLTNKKSLKQISVNSYTETEKEQSFFVTIIKQVSIN